ncbi:C3h4 type zinc finger protein [Apiospora marii]|uniref:C3h4 type zinc finger protein n=1 Tax=Apiospora marii TaxID=335849 RepID=A0ABR1S5G7_9PEZI
MDPSAMDFVMHRSPSEPSRLLPDAMPQHHSPCPAMRAAAAANASEQNQSQGLGAPSRMGGRLHYDPVHGSTSGSSWWQQPPPQQHQQYPHQQQAMPHLGWPPALYPPYARTTASMYAPNYPPVPSPGASNPSTGTSSHIPPRMHTHENYSGHSHPLSQMHSPPTFHHPPTIPSLNRIGGTAPAHHSQGFSTHGNSSDSHVPRTTGLPALHPFSSMGPSQTTHRAKSKRCSTQTFGNNGSSDMDAALRTRQDTGDSQSRGNPEAARFSHEDTRANTGFRRHQPPQPHQPSSPPVADLPVMHANSPHSRRPRFQPSSSEPSSDEDTDPEHDAQTLRFLEAVANNHGVGFMPTYMGSEERIRAQQLLRGTVPGKRVASKGAIASLQSVEVSELTESEKKNPEGVNEAPLRLPKCKHIFGDHCIKKWFEESDSCPYCRDKVPSEPQFQHSHPRSHQAMMHLVRQQHGFGMSQAYGGHRQVRGESSSQNRAENPGRVTSLKSDGSSFRSTWQTSPGRRSPSADFNDSRRRTRARHGSFRGSPPSTRPMSYTATSGGPNPPFPRQYNSSLGRHSMQLSSASPRTRPLDNPAFELNTPPAFAGAEVGANHPTRGSTDASNNGNYPLRSDWRPQWGYAAPDLGDGPDNRPNFQQSP